MTWSRKLSEPITLDAGRSFKTLRDAADFALTLSDRRKAEPVWQYAIELMMKAARRGATTANLLEAERQIRTALTASGLLGIRRDAPRSRPR